MSDQAGKKWCAWCGSWGDHQSGNCIQLTRDEVNQLRKELAAVKADLLEVQQVIGSYHFDIEHPATVIKAIIEGNQKTTEELAAVSKERDELVGAFNKAGQALGPCTDWIATPRDEVLANGISEMRAERDQLREECERLTKDNAELDAEFKESHARAVGMCDKLREELARLKAENERLREALQLCKSTFEAKCEGQHKWPKEAIEDALRAARKL